MENEKDNIVIIKCGNRTPVGSRAALTACGVRAGFARILIHPEFIDETWESIRLGVVDDLQEGLLNHEQFRELALSAFEETISILSDIKTPLGQIPVFIGLPENRPGLFHHTDKVLESALAELGKPFKTDLTFSFIHNGHTSGLIALEKAKALLKTHSFCIIGGVESYHTASTLEWLEMDKKRLLCSTNNDGFVPGQAAGFCLLTTKDTAEKDGLEYFAEVLAIASTEEETEFDTGKNPSGKGLTQAMRSVLNVLPEDSKIDQVYCSLNGESYYTLEYSHAMLYLAKYFKDVNDFIAPFACWGDIGAATAPVFISLIVESNRKKYAKGPYNLITTSSLGKSRACALFKLPDVNKT